MLLFAWTLFLSPYALSEIPQAVPAADADKLKAQGVLTSDDLLARAATARGRKDLAHAAKLDEHRLLGYVELADLLRIPGVGPEMVRLFGAARVHQTKDLAKQDPKRFFDVCVKANDKQKITQNPPDPQSVAAWIEKAKQLPQVVQ
jgi:hypothetical protein